MQQIAGGILVLILNLSVVALGNGRDKPATPAEQFKTLRQEYDRATGSGVPLTDAERLKFVGRRERQEYARILLGSGGIVDQNGLRRRRRTNAFSWA